MATERDFELLDDYISNRLDAAEKASFEKKLEGDPELSQEYSLQQKIADSLRTARARELKTMLNNVPVASIQAGKTSYLVKAGTWVVVTGLVITGLFIYLNRTGSEEQLSQQQQPVPEEVIPETPADTQPAPSSQPQEQKPAVVEDKNGSQKRPPASKDKARANDSTEKLPAEKGGDPVLDVFDPSQEAEGNNAPESTASTENNPRVATTPSITVETDSSNKKYTFHYQFREGKLFLYGSFEKNLYEILEFFTENKRTMFLFYKNNYYLLNEENEKIRPLAAINDPALLKKLREYRGN
jgi:hypothetical protein